PHYLLHLGAALRLLIWECRGFYFHRLAGLPSAEEAIDNALQARAPSEASKSTRFCEAVLGVAIAHFSWHGLSELNTYIALDPLDTDHSIDALAEFLWANRHLNLESENAHL